MPTTYGVNPAAARLQHQHLLRHQDPVTYTVPSGVRIDSQFSMIGALGNELSNLVESDVAGRKVRVKNVTASTLATGALVRLGASARLSSQGVQTSTSSPASGANVILLVPSTTGFEVGQVVTITSGGFSDRALVTAVSLNVSITIDFLFYSHTAPLVKSLPAFEVVLADADNNTPAEWVVVSAISVGAYGYVYDNTEISGLNTSLFALEDLVYLSTTAGLYTTTAPTGANQCQQVVGVVKEVDATTGKIIFYPGNKTILKYGTDFLQDGAVTPAKLASLSGLAAGAVIFGGPSGVSLAFDSANFFWDDTANALGLGNANPVATLDVTGSSAFRASSPAQIVANQNDYAPGTTSWLRLNTDAQRDITSITGGVDGRTLTITNVGSFNINLVNQSGSGTAANRIITGTGADVVIVPDQSSTLRYDATTSRWRIIA